ncbi:hypothetical protein DNU06_01065 [Putridiphycobacter roseus]|uniref:non-specific protein-tyrosine kinase n=1 Tax=Putridiphycobacter roseus TaxID=2219161 RepID=A0A2W1NG34_9FLAO|nr:tyrosine-protein kinase family protein [Putridiphycobacter roseus]PZE18455.1 hypothetical protein DNU06_01065 [Putridiphycobacter roseus]
MSTPSKIENQQKLIQTKDLVFIWRLIRNNLGVIILTPILALLIGYVYTYRLSDVYGAKVQLLLKSNDTYDYQDQIYQGLGAYGAYMDVQNQMRIIRSRDLIGEIIDKMNISTSYYVVGRVRRKEVYNTLPFTTDVEVINGMLFEQPVYVFIQDKKSYRIEYVVNNEEKSIVGTFGEVFINEDFKIKLKKSYSYSAESMDRITDAEYEIVFHSRNQLINKYRSKIDIENLEYTSILEINVLDEIGVRGKLFLDTLTSVYVDYSKRLQLEVNQNTIDNIERQLDTINLFITAKENEILNYKNKNSILNLPKEEDDYFERYVSSLSDKRNLEIKRNALRTLESYIINLNEENFLPPSFEALKSDIYLTQTIKKVYDLQLELKSKSSSQLDNNANIIKNQAEINSLKKDVLIYINNLEGVVVKEISSLDSYISSNRNKIKKIPVSEQGLENISRELEVNNKMYLYLLEKKTNSLITRAGIIPQVRVVETASQLGVVKPDKEKIIRLFVLGGLLVGLFVALIRKLFFEKIQNVNELSEASYLNVVGGLPFVNQKDSKLIVTERPKDQITESFRTLRTNLNYLGDLGNKKGAKKILVSSFFPGEGKTFTSTNVASILSMSDKKVVLVDFDLHKPKVHKTFDIENTKGVSSYLIGKDVLDDVIRKNMLTNLDVITAGPIPPNPSELVLKAKMNDLFAELEKRYEYIIVDTPPFGLLNDGIELIKYLDVFLVVMNTKYIKQKGIRTIENLLSKHDNIEVGLVLNGIKRTRLQYYYSKYSYKYNYSYGYNYGYGYGDTYSDYVEKD